MKSNQLTKKPREKMSIYGVKTLTNTELLAVVLGHGTKRASATDIAKRILQRKKLRQLQTSTNNDLMAIQGIGFSNACRIIAAAELGKRCQVQAPTATKNVRSAKDAYDILRDELQHEEQEKLFGLFLNSRGGLLEKKLLFQGTVDKQIVSAREIARAALQCNAVKVILAHNHPSGDCTPSDADIVVTERITQALDLFGIELQDHIIIANGKFASLF